VAARSILIIDPDAVTRAFVSNVLRQQEYAVVQVGSALDGLVIASRDRPNMVLFEPLTADMGSEEFAARLRQDRRTEHIPLVAFTADASPARRQACMEAGFADFIAKTPEGVRALLSAVQQLAGDLPEIEEPRAVSAPPPSRNGLSIFFISAKGGIGTSSLCANLAMNIAQHEPDGRVAVVDLVLPIGSIAPIVGYEGSQNLVTLLNLSPAELSGELFAESPVSMRPWLFHLVAGSPDPESAGLLRVERIGSLLQQLKRSCDFVLVDAGRSLSKFSLPLLKGADLIVLIVSTDLSSITLTKTLLNYLRSQGIKDRAIFTVLNRAVGLEGLSRAEAERELAIDIKTTFPYLVHFTLANNQHQPFTLKFPTDTTAVLAFQEVAQRIVTAARQLQEAKEHP
jgi:MinD-like ATPase involved in chromosome partitioning or flagellar assembly/CheY-like chemotaxis protein